MSTFLKTDEKSTIIEEQESRKQTVYKFKVRETVYETTKRLITGREVCEVASLLPPENYKLDLRLKGNQYRNVPLDSQVDLEEPGIEKFTYVSRDQTEG